MHGSWQSIRYAGLGHVSSDPTGSQGYMLQETGMQVDQVRSVEEAIEAFSEAKTTMLSGWTR